MLSLNSLAQTKSADSGSDKALKGYISLGSAATTSNTVPFWMRSMKNGSIPLDGVSAFAIGSIQKDYASKRKKSLLDWGAATEVRVNTGKTTELILVEAYAKARMGIFQFKAGRAKELTGLVDSTLSSGAFAVSGNALGIPKVELSVPDFWYLPFTRKVIAFKGNIAHGWMGEQNLNTAYTLLNYTVNTFYHQKTLYGRLGKPNWKVKLYGGFNHQVMWGNEQDIYAGHALSDAETFKYVLIGITYVGAPGVPQSKIGNHVGSIDQGMEVNLKKLQMTGYHQFFYEAGALASLANVKDGIWGLSLKNKTKKNTGFTWHKVLFEFVYSKSQGGEIDSKPRASGAEDYYHNFLYSDGWIYKEENIGNALFTTKKYMRPELPSKGNCNFPNNRIMVLHAGFEWCYAQWHYFTLLSLSNNYGNYNTSPGTRGLGSAIYYHEPPYFGTVTQFSGYLEARRNFKHGRQLSLCMAADKGALLKNSVGGMVKFTQYW